MSDHDPSKAPHRRRACPQRRPFLAQLALVAAFLLTMGNEAAAKNHVVRMLNRGTDGAAMVFEPAFLKIAPGDTVTFTPIDSGHNAELVPGMAPPGAASFKGSINQKLAVRLTKPGLYGYKCLPHVGMGMVGLIQVGTPVNNAEIASEGRKLPGLGKKRIAELLAHIE